MTPPGILRTRERTDLPAIVGHRGAPVQAPENTPASFAAAAAAGADWVELDARRSADGVVVVHHDALLADGRALMELTAAELADAGVCTLAAVLAELPEGLGVDVEVKNLPGDPDFDEDERVAEAVVGLLAERASARPALVSGFNPSTLTAVAGLAPALPTLLLTWGMPLAEGAQLAAALGARGLGPHHRSGGLDAEGLAQAHALGLDVLVWTVNEATEAVALAGHGVDGICSDDPGRVRAALEAAGAQR